MIALLWALAATVLAWIGTGLARRYAIARYLVDVPNERSSHNSPTPRGGGIAIAFVLLGGTGAAMAAGRIESALGCAVLGGGGMVSVVGWIDDHRHVSPILRLVVQSIAAIWALYWLGGMPVATMGDVELQLGRWGLPLAALFIVAFTNFFNFMDGIDGIAAGQAVLAGSVAAVVAWPVGGGVAVMGLLVAGASAGFLVWNRPPARIFMGDVGSGFLGYLLALLALFGERTGLVPLPLSLAVLGMFLLDPTITLFRRILRGERWYTAHRSHTYQRAVRGGLSHGAVTAAVIAINAGFGLVIFAGLQLNRLGTAVAAVVLIFLLVYALAERLEPVPPTRPDLADGR
jgi:Fuc2NAc and GlcNAc transferase